MRVLDHHDRPVDHRPDGNRDASERHNVRVSPLQIDHDEGHQNRHGQCQNCHHRRPDMQEEHDAHQGHDHELLHELLLQRRDRPIDERGPVVHRHDLDTGGQARLKFREPCLDALNHVVGVRARTRDHDAADHFPLAIEFREATADVWPELHRGDVLNRNGCA